MPQTSPVSIGSEGLSWPWRRRLALLVGLALSVGLIIEAQAATTWTVCASGCDYSRIKAAIAAPTTLDGDVLAIAAGVYTEPGIVVHKSLTLQGEDAATTIVQAATTPGTAAGRVFNIPSGVSATLQELTIRYGQTTGNGGGLFNNGRLTLTDSTLRSNKARYSGGGLFNAYPGTLTLTNSTVSDNTATSGGGGLCNGSQGTLTLTNSTVSGNTAGVGGGLLNYSRLTLTHSTVSGNTASYEGGGLYNYASPLTLTTSIVANNPDGGDCVNVSGSMTSHGYNVDSDGSCHLTTTTDLPGTDPWLGPLQDNGGPTFTHALLPGSPALDAIPWGTNGCGTTLYRDQRGQARPQPAGGLCDIGAFEVVEAGQVFGAWVNGFAPHTVTCTNVSTGQAVPMTRPAAPWDCEDAGLGVTAGDRVAMRVRGPVKKGATDIGGAVTGMVPSRAGCMNLTTGQQVTLAPLAGATAVSCGVAGLGMQAGETVQISVQGVAE